MYQNTKHESKMHSHIPANRVRPIDNFTLDTAKNTQGIEWLRKVGIGFLPKAIDGLKKHYQAAAMDTLQSNVTASSIPVPIQFLENWLPGFVHVITAARNIDNFVGISTVGSWEDEIVVQSIRELLGVSQPYGDYTNVPLSSWNPNFVYRTNVRFEEGMRVGLLESAQSARIEMSTELNKREACGLVLEIVRNLIGFYGYNNGTGLTYGFLNDPGLPSYVNVPNGASGSPLWANKTYLEIQKDILTSIAALRLQSKDQINPKRTPLTLALPTATVDYLSKSTDFGYTVWDWLDKNYKNIRVESAPELDAANGGANVFYLYADKIVDSSTDGGQTMIQVVPARFMMLGVKQNVKNYVESYLMATAGIMVKRPWAVVRYSGI